MAERMDKQAALVAPVSLAIPRGQFFDIDQRYYEPQEDNVVVNRSLKPHGSNVTLSRDFVEPQTPLGLQTGSLVVNYGSYIYQQLTGSDAAHLEGGKVQPAVFI
jgi:hypothetical protein